MGLAPNEVEFDGALISEKKDPEHFMELADLVTSLQAGSGKIITAAASNTSNVSPPPFMAGAAEVEIDLETGKVTPIDYAAVVDCGTVINSNLARVQTEGGLVQASVWRFMRISNIQKKEN